MADTLIATCDNQIRHKMEALNPAPPDIDRDVTVTDETTTWRWEAYGHASLLGSWQVSQWHPAPGLDGHPVPEAPERCAVCGMRRHRHWALVARGETPEWVGWSCATGDESLAGMISDESADPLKGPRNFLDRYGEAARYDTLNVIAEALAAIERHGQYVSNRESMETGYPSTSVTVHANLHSAGGRTSPGAEGFLLPAAIVRNWASEAEAHTDFMTHMFRLASQPDVSRWGIGYLSYLPVAYRNVDRDATRAVAASFDYQPGHFGEIGERCEDTITVREVRLTREGLQIVTVSTSTGQRLTWFTSTCHFEPGDTFPAKFTVKRHDVFRGHDTTVVNRIARTS